MKLPAEVMDFARST